MKTTLCFAAALFVGAASAVAQPASHYFTQGDLLYVYDGTQPLPLSNPVSLGFPVTALEFHPVTGELWAHSPNNSFQSGTFYTVDPITGASTMQFESSNVVTPLGQGGAFVSFDFRQNPVSGEYEIVGFNDRFLVDTYEIYSLDGTLLYWTQLGGIFSQSNHPASGYDAVNDVVYGVSSEGYVYTYDAADGSILNQSTGTLNTAVASAGGDYFDGDFWASYNPTRGDTVEFATIDPLSGALTVQFDVTTIGYGGTDTTQGYAVRPGPVCYESETAWSDGDRYTQRGNWATYTEYSANARVALYAGQTLLAGYVEFSAVDPINNTIEITVDLEPGFRFVQGSDNLKIQDYASPPSGNPSPGQFAYKSEQSGDWGYSATVTVPANNYYGVHADVQDLSRPCNPGGGADFAPKKKSKK